MIVGIGLEVGERQPLRGIDLGNLEDRGLVPDAVGAVGVVDDAVDVDKLLVRAGHTVPAHLSALSAHVDKL